MRPNSGSGSGLSVYPTQSRTRLCHVLLRLLLPDRPVSRLYYRLHACTGAIRYRPTRSETRTSAPLRCCYLVLGRATPPADCRKVGRHRTSSGRHVSHRCPRCLPACVFTSCNGEVCTRLSCRFDAKAGRLQRPPSERSCCGCLFHLLRQRSRSRRVCFCTRTARAGARRASRPDRWGFELS